MLSSGMSNTWLGSWSPGRYIAEVAEETAGTGVDVAEDGVAAAAVVGCGLGVLVLVVPRVWLAELRELCSSRTLQQNLRICVSSPSRPSGFAWRRGTVIPQSSAIMGADRPPLTWIAIVAGSCPPILDGNRGFR